MDDAKVRSLLERTVHGSAWSGVTTDGVFAEAAKRRRRRRITATAVAAVAAVTGVVGVPRLMEGQGEEDHRDLASMAGASMKFDSSDSAENKVARLERILPPGRFDEMRMARLTDKWEMKTPDGVPVGFSLALADDDGTLPLMGAFVVRKDDQVGVVGVGHLEEEDVKGGRFLRSRAQGL
ncbi:hypothetical protein [Streptomyces sp. NPDC048057]|uniref:hypothetical protein n=1 Tax=Streptomyces sp. NPDC048057 TaxID=3155628 RepID=UPI00340C9ACF